MRVRPILDRGERGKGGAPIPLRLKEEEEGMRREPKKKREERIFGEGKGKSQSFGVCFGGGNKNDA